MTSSEEIVIRPIKPAEYELVGALTSASYVAQGTIPGGDSYIAVLSDVGARLVQPEVKVFVATVDECVVGTVTYCPYGSALTQVCLPGEFEFRMLAVDLGWLRKGIAKSLIDFCDTVGREQGLTTSVACLAAHNDGARSLYDSMGFGAVPERDWWYSPDELLLTYVREIGLKND